MPPVPIIKILAQQNYLAGNPMIVLLWTYENKSAIFRIVDGDNPNVHLYQGEAYSNGGWASVDIANIFDFKQANAKRYIISLINIDTELEYAYREFNVYAGGVSDLCLEQLLTIPNVDDFVSWKFKNVTENFLLTTRNFSSRIFIPENEVMPLLYYAKNMVFEIWGGEMLLLSRNHTAQSPDDPEFVESIDIASLRRNVAINHNKLISEFRIKSGGNWSFSIYLTEAEPTDYYIEFLNSFGAWERFALYNEVQFIPSFDEVQRVKKFDLQLNKHRNNNLRKTRKSKYLAKTNPLEGDKLFFALDMLHSEDVFFVVRDKKFACDLFLLNQFPQTKNEPCILELEIDLRSEDKFFSPFISDDNIYVTINNEVLTAGEADIII